MTKETFSKRQAVILSLVLGIAAMCLYTSNGRFTGTSDTIPAALLPLSILDEKNLDFNEFSNVHEPQPSWYVVKNDRVVSYYPIMPGILNTFTHLVSRQFGFICKAPCTLAAKFTSAAVSAASVSFLFLTLIRLCQQRQTVLVITILYGVCTCVWSVASQGLWQHGPSLFFLTAALACLVRPERRWVFALGGFFLGMAVFNRPTNIMFAIPATIYVLWRHPRLLGYFLLAAFIPALLMAWYSWEYWGSLLALGQGHSMSSGTHGSHTTNFNYPLLKGMAGLLFSPGRGLFVFSPFFLFGVPLWLYALWPWAKIDPLYRFIAFGALANLFLFSSWSIWWGGWSFGYRMLLEIVPFLMILLAATYERWITPHRGLHTIFIITTLISFYIHFLGATFYPTDWNSRVDIDSHPERTWDWYDSELKALHKEFTTFLKIDY
ncbi:hypothetical protein ACFL0S_03210 [Thermodesulfobacteriota bacterium]